MSTLLTFGYHDRTAPRQWNINKTLRSDGFEIVECHTVKKGIFGKYFHLWKTYKQLTAHSSQLTAILVTFPGHYLVPLAWFLTRYPRKKLIFDVFISLYDTNVCDRKRFAKWNPFSWFLYIADFVSCHLSDEILIDTEEHKRYFVKMFKVKPEKVRVIYLGTREDLFYEKQKTKNKKQRTDLPLTARYNILFYGTYIPLQGVEYILQAAKVLQDTHPEIHFTLIGKGQTYPAMRKFAEEKQIKNVTFEAPIPYEELPDRIRSTELCLGIFGTTDKAKRVIPHKVYDAVACGTPIITADTPAIREKFAHHVGVILCETGNSEQLATAISHYFSTTKSPITSASNPQQ